MKIDKKGITFSYYGDQLTWTWPWSEDRFSGRYYSAKYIEFFPSKNKYWQHVGQLEERIQKLPKSKINSFNYEEILMEWLELQTNNEFLLALYDIDVSKKPTNFWMSLGTTKALNFTKDVVILRCKSRIERSGIMRNLEPDFCKFVFNQGNGLD